MRPSSDLRPAGRPAGDLRPHVSFSLVKVCRLAGAGDLRMTCVSEGVAARVVGVGPRPPHPHRTHAAMAPAQDWRVAFVGWKTRADALALSPIGCFRPPDAAQTGLQPPPYPTPPTPG